MLPPELIKQVAMLRAVGALLHKERNIAITLSFCETRRKRAVQLAPNTALPFAN